MTGQGRVLYGAMRSGSSANSADPLPSPERVAVLADLPQRSTRSRAWTPKFPPPQRPLIG